YAEELRAPSASTRPLPATEAAPPPLRAMEPHAPVNALPSRRPTRRVLQYSVAGLVLSMALYGAIGLRQRPTAIAAATHSGSATSLVVLPLVDMSEDRSAEPLADGMTEELTA